MLELIVVVSGLVSNFITNLVKPSDNYVVSQEDIDARKTLVRGINLAFGALTLIAGTWLLGEPLDVSSLSDMLTSLVSIILTFAVSQSAYHLNKK